MKIDYFFEQEWCQVWHDKELDALTANWCGRLTLDQVKEANSIVLEYINKNKPQLHYSNLLNLKILNREIQQYCINDWYPNLYKSGVEQLAQLMPLDAYAKASIEKINQEYKIQGDLNIFTFGFEKECLNWLKVNRSISPRKCSIKNKVSAYQMLKVEEEVKALDPLKIDGILSEIQNCNRERNVNQLIDLLYVHLPSPDKLSKANFYESLAMMRDIGLFLGSIKRHHVEPITQVPELEFILEELSSKTNLPPRDTLLHYTMWNPDGPRRRLYTDITDELGLVDSVKHAMPALEAAIDNLIQLHHTRFDKPDFAVLCQKASKKFQSVIDSIVMAHRTVGPKIFAKELRFYFDPIQFGDEEIIGPGAVEMPMFVYDHLLWSSQVKAPEYVKFKQTYLRFNLPFMRDIYRYYEQHDSLVDKALVALTINPSEEVLRSANALLNLCNKQKSFRKPHKKLAEESYAHQDKITGKQHGSGGYSTDILSYISHLNESKIDQLKEKSILSAPV